MVRPRLSRVFLHRKKQTQTVVAPAVGGPASANAEFVCAMEDVLEAYTRPYDPSRPVICLDETSKQLVAETRIPLSAEPGQPERVDYEYERRGIELFTCSRIHIPSFQPRHCPRRLALKNIYTVPNSGFVTVRSSGATLPDLRLAGSRPSMIGRHSSRPKSAHRR